MKEKYIVCFSGGHSSALAAIETVKRYGKDNVLLLNHNISAEVEHEDIKRYKNEIANYLELKITYANMKGWEHMTPLRVCKSLGGFKFGNSPVLCTTKLKTEPFYKWLKENYPVKKGEMREDITIIYGFDKDEKHRITRRSHIMKKLGYKTDYPLAYWDRTLKDTAEIGIKKPLTYKTFRHANCIGCLKAGKQSWYLVYCLYPKLWQEAIETEKEIGYSILRDTYLKDLEPKFNQMKCNGIFPSENLNPQKFWSMVNKSLPANGQLSFLPCKTN